MWCLWGEWVHLFMVAAGYEICAMCNSLLYRMIRVLELDTALGSRVALERRPQRSDVGCELVYEASCGERIVGCHLDEADDPITVCYDEKGKVSGGEEGFRNIACDNQSRSALQPLSSGGCFGVSRSRATVWPGARLARIAPVP